MSTDSTIVFFPQAAGRPKHIPPLKEICEEIVLQELGYRFNGLIEGEPAARSQFGVLYRESGFFLPGPVAPLEHIVEAFWRGMGGFHAGVGPLVTRRPPTWEYRPHIEPGGPHFETDSPTGGEGQLGGLYGYIRFHLMSDVPYTLEPKP